MCRDLEELGSTDDCFEMNDRASEASYGSGNSGQDGDHQRVSRRSPIFLASFPMSVMQSYEKSTYVISQRPYAK